MEPFYTEDAVMDMTLALMEDIGWDVSQAGDLIGVFRNGGWFLDLNGNGDWNGDGTDDIGVFRNGAWFLDRNGNDQWDDCSLDGCYYLGMAGDEPLSGKW